MTAKTKAVLSKIVNKMPDSKVLLALSSAIILGLIMYLAILLLSPR